MSAVFDKSNHSSLEPVNIFWTGGWDSTFRLLQLVMEEQRSVQPHYIIYQGRPSFQMEIDTMEKIRTQLHEQYPDAAKLILPTIFTLIDEMDEDEEIMKAYQQANALRSLAMQNTWLAKYCKQHQILDMEYCSERRINPQDRRFFDFLKKEEDSPVYTYNLELRDRPEYVLLKYFRFPIYGFTKPDIEKYARENGWLGILKKTWSCYTPLLGRYPCGTCSPCRQSIKEGTGWRIPLFIRILNRVSLIKSLKSVKHKVLAFWQEI